MTQMYAQRVAEILQTPQLPARLFRPELNLPARRPHPLLRWLSEDQGARWYSF